MTEKRFTIKESTITDGYCIFDNEKEYAFVPVDKKAQLEPTVKVLDNLHEEVLYWKQVASQRGNEIEVMTHKLQMK